MKILVIGCGGREHALVWKLAQSARVEKIYCAPGNAGTAQLGINIPIADSDISSLLEFAKENKIDLTVVGPEIPLVAGIVDVFESENLRIFGPNARAALLEGSKVFTKELLSKYHIPTATYEQFNEIHSAKAFLRSISSYPVVIKADGLAAGKGVLIVSSQEEAERVIGEMMEDRVFGDAGSTIIIEEHLRGPELSLLCFVDTHTIVPMVSAKDYKRIGEGETGLNTGGMGAISPNPLYTQDLEDNCLISIIKPTLTGLREEGRPFKGILYCGIMLTKSGPKVLEYNVRFGDPETQVILPRLKTDLVEIFEAIIDDRLNEVDIQWDQKTAATIVLASSGYPESYSKGFLISGFTQVKTATVFHAGTKQTPNGPVTNGGRVLAITSIADSLDEALDLSYAGADNIKYTGKTLRTDIGS